MGNEIFLIFIFYFCVSYRHIKKTKFRLLYFHIVFSTDLQAMTSSLDFRVTVLEENGGDGGNSSVAELEGRVETLKGTAADHETRISATEVDVNGNYFSSEIFHKIQK